MTLKEIVFLLNHSVAAASGKIIASHAIQPAQITKTSAYRAFGRCNVDRWIKEGIITLSNKKLNTNELQAIAARSNRRTYLPVAER